MESQNLVLEDRGTDLLLSDRSGWVVLLIDGDRKVEAVHRCESLSEGASWLDEWMADPLDCTPVLVPARGESEVMRMLDRPAVETVTLYDVEVMPAQQVVRRHLERDLAETFAASYNGVAGDSREARVIRRTATLATESEVVS